MLQPVGPVSPFNPKNKAMADKAGETTLDVEWSHAIAPGAKILLVETPVAENAAGRGFRQYMAAGNYVVNHNLGDVISQSFSLPEQNFGRAQIQRLRYAYLSARGTASRCSPPRMTPASQVRSRRGVCTAISGAVLTFSSFMGSPRWGQAGGASEATPEFAASSRSPDQYATKRLHKRRLGLINSTLYLLYRRHARGIVDVTKGNNTVAFVQNGKTTTVNGYCAKRGYDLVTGIGTIDAALFVPELARAG